METEIVTTVSKYLERVPRRHMVRRSSGTLVSSGVVQTHSESVTRSDRKSSEAKYGSDIKTEDL